MEPGHLNPACLPSGTLIGPWRVEAPLGRGTFGVVYRAVAAEHGGTDSVALKVALYPWDKRFAREAELLSRLRHPAVPRLLDHGQWESPAGVTYAWLVMEWVDGTPLYDWARAQRPTSRQVLQVLARLARALEATHAAGGLHRDVKGDNVRVRRSDGQAFLMDFGSGHYLGAATLTDHPLPPGTQTYRAPETWRYGLRPRKPSDVPYSPGPADDVFALGVTAYRLLTEEYPPSSHPEDEDSRRWLEEERASWAPRACNGRCAPELDALVSRMLSLRPEARGSAREVAEALEQAAREAGPGADVPLFTGEEPRPAGLFPAPRRVMVRPPPSRVPRWSRFVAASAAACLSLGLGMLLGTRPLEAPETPPLVEREEAKDGGSVAVGDSALTAPVSPERAPSMLGAIAVDLPPKPLPGQSRPDAYGRCPRRGQVPINGGCWRKVEITDMKDCDEDAYMYRGACYAPMFSPPRPATSGTAEHADGG
ncbi:serine/threonine protein kinase [Pyxidicoccus sp. 3LFB2]